MGGKRRQRALDGEDACAGDVQEGDERVGPGGPGPLPGQLQPRVDS
jgi:hypothetical protein